MFSILELQLIVQEINMCINCVYALVPALRNGSLRMAGKKAARDATFPHLPPPHTSCWFAGPEVEVAVHRCGTHHPRGQIVANQQCFHQLSSPLLQWSFPPSVEFELHNNQAKWVIVVLKLSHWHFMLLLFVAFAQSGAWSASPSVAFQLHLLVHHIPINSWLKQRTAGPWKAFLVF